MKTAIQMDTTNADSAKPAEESLVDLRHLADLCKVQLKQVVQVLKLRDEGATVPFIARYRKEASGNLDEVQIRLILDEEERLLNLEKRRAFILTNLQERSVLDSDLERALKEALTLSELEELYKPYKQKKKTRGELAKARGLGPLASKVPQLSPEQVEKEIVKLVGSHEELPDAASVFGGLVDILSEQYAHRPEIREALKVQAHQKAQLGVEALLEADELEKSPYRMYADFSSDYQKIKPHQWLAIQRGQREKQLRFSWDLNEKAAEDLLKEKIKLPGRLPEAACHEALKRHLIPYVQRDLERQIQEQAETQALAVFVQNLKPVLLQAPLKGRPILAVDPGLRTGCKAVGLDPQGKFLGYFTFYTNKPEEALNALLEGLKRFKSELLVLGNGTGSSEVQELFPKLQEKALDLQWTIVPEDGASVYSASDIARKEFPQLDVSIRGAISLGRRVLDPLSELVKVDPKSLGLGMYQHDLDQKNLEKNLHQTVEETVNQVGVLASSASAPLLSYVSGLGPVLAQKIVDYRESGKPLKCRKDLLKVPGLGAKTFEQCAGFIKFPESEEALDNTWVHPESYPLARELQVLRKNNPALTALDRKNLAQKYALSDQSLQEIIQELDKPNRSPRDNSPLPPMYSKRLVFEDLAEGMILPGLVKNLVDFGAFIDLGLKESGLVHISEMADHFVSKPSEVLTVGETRDFRIISLDTLRRRIGLSLKSQGKA